MNTTYKMLWIDDDDDFTGSTTELIESAVKENNMIPIINIYSDYVDYQKKEIDNFDLDVFNLYDQIVVDYALSGITGDMLIRDLRARNIFTDIVFYSSDFDKMQQEVVDSREQLDGVFFSRRENLTSVVDKVLKKNLKREYSISNIRGLIMDSTSDFDYICRTTTLALFEKLPLDKQHAIAEKAKEYVSSARKKSNGSFESLEKLDGEKLLKKALQSVDYVMDNKDRYSILSLVVREFEETPISKADFASNYQAELIKPRNDLAHSKLFYGHCQKRIHIAKDRQKLECDTNCEHCASKYSIEKCEELRKVMFSYFNLFHDIDEKTNSLCSLH